MRRFNIHSGFKSLTERKEKRKERKKEIIAIQYLHVNDRRKTKKISEKQNFHFSTSKSEKKQWRDKREKSNIEFHYHLIAQATACEM